MTNSIHKVLSRLLPSQFEVLKRTANQAHRISGKKEITILDLGAGGAQYYESEIFGSIEFTISVDLLDAFPHEGKLNPPSSVSTRRILGVVPEDLSKIPNNKYDLVVAFDLIEHLSREDGYKLLYEVDRISEYASLIFTPNGFVWQPPTEKNSFDAHLSGWTPAELKGMGWSNLRGHGGPRRMRGPYGEPTIDIKPWLIRIFDSSYSVFSQLFVKHAFAFSAVKFGKNPRIEP